MIKLVTGEKYNFKDQPERLIYLGQAFDSSGYWHQFAKTNNPDKIWCEIQNTDLHLIEKTEAVE